MKRKYGVQRGGRERRELNFWNDHDASCPFLSVLILSCPGLPSPAQACLPAELKAHWSPRFSPSSLIGWWELLLYDDWRTRISPFRHCTSLAFHYLSITSPWISLVHWNSLKPIEAHDFPHLHWLDGGSFANECAIFRVSDRHHVCN